MVKDYSKGKIYKIVSDSCDDIYIGSTVVTLSRRLTRHRSGYKAWKKGKGGHVRSFSLLERGDYHIILIEPFPCKNQEELTARERWYIDNNKCLNKVIPGRTRKERYQANKDNINEKRREYTEKNKDKITEQKKKWRETNKEKIKEQVKEYRQQNKEKLSEYMKEYNQGYYQNNKDKIKEQMQRTFQCLCDGEQHNLSHRARHFRTQYHITNLKSICDIYGVNPSDVY